MSLAKDLIKDGFIIDSSGNKSFKGDVGITRDKIFVDIFQF